MKYGIFIFILFTLLSCQHKVKQLHKQGMDYILQEKYEQAIPLFSKAIQTDKDWLPAYYNRAICYANTKQYPEALKDFNYILANCPAQAEAYFNRGIVYENLGLYSNAIKD